MDPVRRLQLVQALIQFDDHQNIAAVQHQQQQVIHQCRQRRQGRWWCRPWLLRQLAFGQHDETLWQTRVGGARKNIQLPNEPLPKSLRECLRYPGRYACLLIILAAICCHNLMHMRYPVIQNAENRSYSMFTATEKRRQGNR